MQSSMGLLYATALLLSAIVMETDCQGMNLQADPSNPLSFLGTSLLSFAAPVPGATQKTSPGSISSDPQPPAVLLNAFKTTAPPQGASPADTSMQGLMSMFGSSGSAGGGASHSASGHGTTGAGFSIPITANVKAMVTKMANQLGHKAYYEAHGCVDPTTTLHGRHGSLAGMAFMMGCNSHQANEVCNMAQLSHAGAQGASMRTMMEAMLGKDMKHMLEQCLTPSTIMNGFMGSMAGLQGNSQTGYAPPPEAASAAGSKAPVDCSSVSQMLMMSTAAEGLMNPEALEQIGVMRNRYFKMTCQENMIMGSLPYRLCCPGYVKPPTMQEAMMIRSMAHV